MIWMVLGRNGTLNRHLVFLSIINLDGLLEVEFDIFSSFSGNEIEGCYYGIPAYYDTGGSGGSSGSGSGGIISNDGASLKPVNPATW